MYIITSASHVGNLVYSWRGNDPRLIKCTLYDLDTNEVYENVAFTAGTAHQFDDKVFGYSDGRFYVVTYSDWQLLQSLKFIEVCTDPRWYMGNKSYQFNSDKIFLRHGDFGIISIMKFIRHYKYDENMVKCHSDKYIYLTMDYGSTSYKLVYEIINKANFIKALMME